MLRRLVLAAAILVPFTAVAQDSAPAMGGGNGAFAGMERVAGEVTTVAPASLGIKAADGTAYTVTVTENTRIMRGRAVRGEGSAVMPGAIKFADIKPGDGIMAMGNLDTPHKTLHAAVVFATDAAQVKALKDNMGKTYITGKVTAIDADNARMTVERTDGVSQTIAFDETTSFKRSSGRFQRQAATGETPAAAPPPATSESITLADIKVGDMVAGRGAFKSGTFVPTELSVLPPNPRRHP